MPRFAAAFALVVLVAGLVAAAVVPDGLAAGRGRDRGRAERSRPDEVVVSLAPGAGDAQTAAADIAADLGLEITEVFPASDAFAAVAPVGRAARLKRDRRVAVVEPNARFVAHGELTTGADRIGADRDAEGRAPAGPGKPVAVLDTGIAAHPDLNVGGGYNCVGRDRTDWDDGNGHGTHVAGIIGARADGRGVAGVAPGTTLWAVRVLGDDGSGSTRSVACGLNWAIANARAKNIAVVNLSLGARAPKESRSNCASSATHNAICKLARMGVRVVVSAGNDGANARDYAPAKFDQVTTVSALADTDGCAGGEGGQLGGEADDSLATFSNDGPAVDVAAPGVNVVSTAPGGGTALMSGTSQAAPHVAAAFALGWKPGEKEAAPLAGDDDGIDEGVVRLSANTGCRGLRLPGL